ncbi:DedA [Candidatus Koribacter versatilis Ellin345]|uniref:DedA n=1 Tax=Koribacter versatilis (strain Ellin345) TaxID=204669 RepID=Q1IQ90_KORVE|nr:DedA family protein [Candidatus Koribacter versatilis]ABF40960.1 DedA [Candidatus Koribacter versatilis Ellin345]
MLHNLIAVLGEFIIHVISSTGYLGVMLLMAIESACIPLPSEVIMPFSGYLVYTGRFQLLWVATAGAIGCNVGSVIAYEIGYVGGRPLVNRWGRFILLNHHDLDRAEQFFKRFGDITVLVARLLPVVRTFIALPAGIAKMPRLRFHVYTFVGSWPWCFLLAYVGMKLGERWETDPRLKMWLHRFDAIIVAALVIVILLFVRSHWKNRVKAEA